MPNERHFSKEVCELVDRLADNFCAGVSDETILRARQHVEGALKKLVEARVQELRVADAIAMYHWWNEGQVVLPKPVQVPVNPPISTAICWPISTAACWPITVGASPEPVKSEAAEQTKTFK